jgi:TetR/AcrR family transcriptional regulator, cholesterol catabolism regulator
MSNLVGGSASETKTAVRPRQRQDRRRRETERKLLAAGLEELRCSPSGELSIRSVADRAQVSAANAYKYFPSKSALVAAIYLDLLQKAPLHTDGNVDTVARVIATMHDMALVAAERPALAVACAAVLVANEPAVKPFREEIAEELARRIAAALGPGWSPGVNATLRLIFAGALIAARFVSFDQVAAELDVAVSVVLEGASSR